MVSKRHHYVPQFHLRHFLDAAGRLWVYEKEDGAVRAQTPINTAVKGHFYTFERSGKKNDELEKQFSHIETMASPILCRWQRAGVRPTLEARSKLSIFLATIHARVPRTIESTREAAEVLFAADLKEIAASPTKTREAWDRYIEALGNREPSLAFNDFEQYLRDPALESRVQVNEKWALAMSFYSSMQIAPLLVSMNWSLRDAPIGSVFVTSDTPLNIFCPRGRGKASFGGGLDHPGVEVAFPISPRLCLFITRRDGDQRRRASVGFVREINRRMAAAAERLIIASVKSDAIQGLVGEFSFTRAKRRTDTEGVLALRRKRESE